MYVDTRRCRKKKKKFLFFTFSTPTAALKALIGHSPTAPARCYLDASKALACLNECLEFDELRNAAVEFSIEQVSNRAQMGQSARRQHEDRWILCI